MITVSDWAAYDAIRRNFLNVQLRAKYKDAIAEYLASNIFTTNATYSEKTFLTVFGNILIFLKLNTSTGKYEAFELSSNGTTTKKNCP